MLGFASWRVRDLMLGETSLEGDKRHHDRSRTHPAAHWHLRQDQHPDHDRHHPRGHRRGSLPPRRDRSRHRWPEALVLIGRTTRQEHDAPAEIRGGVVLSGRGSRGVCRLAAHADLVPNCPAQRLIMCPAMPSMASFTASLSVGWAKTLRATSSAVRSHCWASVSAGSSSVTSGPIMWAPSSSLCSASATILTKPTPSAMPRALPLAEKGKLAVLTS